MGGLVMKNENWYIFGTILVIFITSVCIIFYRCEQDNKYTSFKDTGYLNLHSESIKYIEEKCGVIGSDYLWTTAMDKISRCLQKHDLIISDYREILKS